MEIIGIDPGLVHTGLVLMRFDKKRRTITVEHAVLNGPDATGAAQWVNTHTESGFLRLGFIEAYRPRATAYSTDDKMVKAVSAFKQSFPRFRVLDNTGVKKVVRRPLLELIGAWNFSTPTNHQDLRSAARIGIYGALKEEDSNHLIADVVRDHLNGRDWNVDVL